ncbi:hypothetical protein YERSI8AC_220210 [Enterobacterales bacterium 8AC]|nr:hypothetical protein YERSI8AC_220210 [Enterobacterales bacterium 8AC]
MDAPADGKLSCKITVYKAVRIKSPIDVYRAFLCLRRGFYQADKQVVMRVTRTYAYYLTSIRYFYISNKVLP